MPVKPLWVLCRCRACVHVKLTVSPSLISHAIGYFEEVMALRDMQVRQLEDICAAAWRSRSDHNARRDRNALWDWDTCAIVRRRRRIICIWLSHLSHHKPQAPWRHTPTNLCVLPSAHKASPSNQLQVRGRHGPDPKVPPPKMELALHLVVTEAGKVGGDPQADVGNDCLAGLTRGRRARPAEVHPSMQQWNQRARAQGTASEALNPGLGRRES